MIGLRVGIKAGPRVGPAVGVGADPTSAAGASRDAASGIYVPATSSEWSSLGLTAPGNLWLCQESSGNLADSIGSISLTAVNGPTYQQSVSGWTRKAVSTTDGTANQNFGSTAAALPDIATTSAMLLMYAQVTTIGATRGSCLLGTTTTAELRALTTPAYRMLSGANLATGASNPTGSVRPIVVKIDRTGSTCKAYTNQEIMAPTFSSGMTGKQVMLGYSGGAPPTQLIVYAALWQGSAAERTDAQVRSMLQSLGWTIPW